MCPHFIGTATNLLFLVRDVRPITRTGSLALAGLLVLGLAALALANIYDLIALIAARRDAAGAPPPGLYPAIPSAPLAPLAPDAPPLPPGLPDGWWAGHEGAGGAPFGEVGGAESVVHWRWVDTLLSQEMTGNEGDGGPGGPVTAVVRAGARRLLRAIAHARGVRAPG